MNDELEKKLNSRFEIFKKIHEIILSLNPEIKHRLSTVYVRYMLGDKIIAVIYFRGKFVSECRLNGGFSFKEKSTFPDFKDGKFMNYPGINYSLEIKSDKDITSKLVAQLKKSIF